MKLILALICPENLSAVQTALDRDDVFLVTVSQVIDCRQEESSVIVYRGHALRRPATRMRLEVAVADEFFEEAVTTIRHAAGSGQFGDDKVFVMGLDEFVTFRPTGQRTECFAIHH